MSQQQNRTLECGGSQNRWLWYQHHEKFKYEWRHEWPQKTFFFPQEFNIKKRKIGQRYKELLSEIWYAGWACEYFFIMQIMGRNFKTWDLYGITLKTLKPGPQFCDEIRKKKHSLFWAEICIGGTFRTRNFKIQSLYIICGFVH
jgi:hypothetical protein